MFDSLGINNFGSDLEKQGGAPASQESGGDIDPEVIMELSGAWQELKNKLEAMTPAEKIESLNETLEEVTRIARTYITHVNRGTFPTGVYTNTRDMLTYLEGNGESTLFTGITEAYDQIRSLLGKK